MGTLWYKIQIQTSKSPTGAVPVPGPEGEFLGAHLPSSSFPVPRRWRDLLWHVCFVFAVRLGFWPVFFLLSNSLENFPKAICMRFIHLESLPSFLLLRVLPCARAEWCFIAWTCVSPPARRVVASNAGMRFPYTPAFCVSGEQCLRVLLNCPLKKPLPFPPAGCARTSFSISSQALHVINL